MTEFSIEITIPIKYFETLGFENELECIYSGDMLILTPIRNENSAFAEEILEDLIKQGYSGEALLIEFKKINRKVRPAVEKLINEADAIAKKSSVDYTDHTHEIFGVAEESED